MPHNEIKSIIVEKFKKEHCIFTENDIKVHLIGSHIEIQIKGYEHILHKLIPEKVDVDFLEPYMVTIYESMPLSKHPNDKISVGCFGSYKDYPFEEALEYLAYHIASTY